MTMLSATRWRWPPGLWKVAGSIALVFAFEPAALAEPTVDCFNRIAAGEALASIRGKMALGNVNGTTFAMLADENVPTPEQRTAIFDWASGRAACMTENEDSRERALPPQLAALAMEAENRMMVDTVELYRGSISFGTFNARRKALTTEVSSRWAPIVQNAKLQLQTRDTAARSADAQEQAQRRAALLGLINSMRPPHPVEVILPPPRPITTNCARVLNGVSCTTQ